MAITNGATATGSNTLGNAAAVSLTGVTTGHLMLLWAAISATTPPSTPAGWTSIATQTVGNTSFGLYYRLKQAGDTTVSVGGGSLNNTDAALAAFSGCVYAEVSTAATGTAAATTIDPGAVTINATSSASIILVGTANGPTWTFPTGWTQRVNNNAGRGVAIASNLSPTAGSLDPSVCTAASSVIERIAYQVELASNTADLAPAASATSSASLTVTAPAALALTTSSSAAPASAAVTVPVAVVPAAVSATSSATGILVTGKLPKWKTALRRLKNGTGSATAVCIGDSITERYVVTNGLLQNAWTVKLGLQMAAQAGLSHGSIYVPAVSSKNVTDFASWQDGPGATDPWTRSGSLSPSQTSHGLGARACNLLFSGSYISFPAPAWATHATVFFAGSGGEEHLEVLSNNVSVGSAAIFTGDQTERTLDVTLQGSGNVLKCLYSNAFTATGNLYIDGVLFEDRSNGAGKQARIIESGHGGSHAHQFATGDPDTNHDGHGQYWAKALANCVPDLVVVYLGVNDAQNGYSLTQFEADMNTLSNQIDADCASPPDLLYVSHCYTDASLAGGSFYSPSTWAGFEAVIATIASQHGQRADYMSMTPALGVNDVAGRAWTTDLIHPNVYGADVMASAFGGKLLEIPAASMSPSTAGTSSATGTLSIRAAMAPAATGTSAATAAITFPVPLAPSAGATATATMALGIALPIAPTATAASSCTATVTAAPQVGGTATPAATASAALASSAQLAPAVSAAATATLTVTAAARCAPTAAGAAAATVAVTAAPLLAPAPSATSSATASLTVPGVAFLGLQSDAVSAATGALTVAVPIAPTVAAPSSVTAAVTFPAAMSPTVAASSTATGALTMPVALSPSTGGAAVVTGGLTGTPVVAPQASGVSGVTAVMTTPVQMAPVVFATAGLTGTLIPPAALRPAVAATGGVTLALGVPCPLLLDPVDLAASIHVALFGGVPRTDAPPPVAIAAQIRARPGASVTGRRPSPTATVSTHGN